MARSAVRARSEASGSPTRHRASRVPPNETPREKFLRIANGRVKNAMHHLELLGPLASSSYEWSDDDVLLMYNTLLDTLDSTFGRFKQERPPRRSATFNLPELLARGKEGVR